MIAVGGMGGSGTRVVARILKEAGIYMGDDLNESFDNIWFTRLFKSYNWYRKAAPHQITRRLEIFERLMEGERLSIPDISQFVQAGLSNDVFPMSKYQVYRFLRHVLGDTVLHDVWGWKEPNTQFYINYINNYFDGIKYIHVIRDGIEMAYSTNRQQLQNWGPRFGILEQTKPVEVHQLDYWIRSNEFAIQTGREKLKQNFYLLHYNKLSLEPKQEIIGLLEFLKLNIDHETFDRLMDLPTISKRSMIDYDTSLFTQEQLEKVKLLSPPYSP